jgi:FkbM family methyltransferase
MIKRALAHMRGRTYGLKSKDIRERPYEIIVNGQAKTLFHSAFNTDWLPELGITPDTIVDLGSFDGGDAYRFKATFPDARVITVEADPTRHAIVSENLSGQEIEIANHAACGTDGDIDWYPAAIDGQADAQGSIFKHTEAYQKKFSQVEQAKTPDKVAGKRFDTFAKEANIETVSLLHMDIEGAEHSVLQTLGPVRPRLIYLEWREGFFQGKACGPETEAMLADMGYKLILQKTADRLYFLPGR